MPNNSFPNYSWALLILNKQFACSTLVSEAHRINQHRHGTPFATWHHYLGIFLLTLHLLPQDVARMPDALGVLMRDFSLPAPLAVQHLFRASAVHHKREIVKKTMHGNETISKLFGLHCLINSVLEYLLWCSFSGQGHVNIQSSLLWEHMS